MDGLPLPALPPAAAPAAPVRVVLATELGEVEIEVDVARAPRTARVPERASAPR